MSKEMRSRIKGLIDIYYKSDDDVPVWVWDLADRVDKIIQQEKRKSYEQGVKEEKKRNQISTCLVEKNGRY